MTEAGGCGYPGEGCGHQEGGQSQAENAEVAVVVAEKRRRRGWRRGEGLNEMSEQGSRSAAVGELQLLSGWGGVEPEKKSANFFKGVGKRSSKS